ncbi:MAG TPA: amidohydrolase family protein [Vicinamibacterales bacterium]|nr:amidohydrolase family protein [Vicinamibacterales bacterium]
MRQLPHFLLALVISGLLGVTVASQTVAPRLRRAASAPPPAATVDVPVSEGTSMSVAVSPDGRRLAIDLQGSIWVLPAAGGQATRITDVFNDARQPAWSPDGQTIAFFAYRDGGYDLWAVAPDGTNQRKLTTGAYDDREPVWSHDGRRIAFSSDRGDPLGSNYNIWTLDLASGTFLQLTTHAAEDSMPSWSGNDADVSFVSTRAGGHHVWAVPSRGGEARMIATSTGVVDAASWSPGGPVVAHALAGTASRLETDGATITGTENVFPFRPSWASATEFFYTADGKIRKRALGGAAFTDVPFAATLQATPARYTRLTRDFDSRTPRQTLGLVRPVLSPDGTRVAFAAVGDIWVMPVGGAAENLTKDRFLDTDPAWSPDGTKLAYSSDKGGQQLQLWIRDLTTGQDRQLTNMTNQPQGAAWSNDGSKIAFFDVDGMWRRAQVSVVDVASGAVTRIHASLFSPGTPTWSPDGARVAVAMVSSYSTRFREGTNQVLTMSSSGGDDTWFVPDPNLSIDSRGGGGVVWSPDGTKMAGIYEGLLKVWPVSKTGQPLGPPRRMTTGMAHSPSWAGDSRRLLYQSMDQLKIVDIETGATTDVPVNLTWTPAVPTGRITVHVSRLVDGLSEVARENMDIVVVGNRIRSVAAHSAAAHTGTVIDGSNLTAMPGLIEFHSHLQKDFGEAQGRAWLAFGITTVRSPGNTPYEAVEDKEANEAGVRAGPRVYGTGYLMEWQRVYYKMGVAISSVAHFEMELQRAKVLQHDLIKSYVRLPDLQQKRMVEFAHGIGIPVATHEIFPAALVGVDNTEHTAATSRRGYSPKQTTQQRAYQDVVQLFGKSERYLCPMISGGGVRRLLEGNPGLRDDARFTLYPKWMQDGVRSPVRGAPGGGADSPGNDRMVMDIMRAGGKIVAGTDTPNGLNLHGELNAYVKAGMTPAQALRAATVTAAEALNLDAGAIAVGKLADIVLVDGNPLQDIGDALQVKRVIANGRSYTMDDLLKGRQP